MGWPVLLGVVLGGVLGFLMGRAGSCTTGACPLTSNPWIGMIYGAVAGALIGSTFSGPPGGAT